MNIVVKKFQELTIEELYEILKIRAEVFVVEQNCPYQDLDGVDQEAYHVYLQEERRIVAYLRVVDKGKRLDEVSIGRVISLKRRQGVGTELMKAGLAVAKEKFGATVVKVGAQVYAKPFYERAGFRQVSEEYLEDGIPHIYMLYEGEINQENS
ncbi:MAG: GNAT family N-acetyltransferase [Clostridia bacterium]|nr:GNAT family N-acetyltransferase [Clostridia bacterium]